MKPSSMACRILYTWKGWKLPSSHSVPKISSVCAFGVAVKAKKERF